jgi:hypothetical protein
MEGSGSGIKHIRIRIYGGKILVGEKSGKLFRINGIHISIDLYTAYSIRSRNIVVVRIYH